MYDVVACYEKLMFFIYYMKDPNNNNLLVFRLLRSFPGSVWYMHSSGVCSVCKSYKEKTESLSLSVQNIEINNMQVENFQLHWIIYYILCSLL